MCVYVCACLRACVRVYAKCMYVRVLSVRVRMCVCVCVRARACACVRVSVLGNTTQTLVGKMEHRLFMKYNVFTQFVQY